MWVEVDTDQIAETLHPGDKVRVVIPGSGGDYFGTVVAVYAGATTSNTYVSLVTNWSSEGTSNNYPITLYAFGDRKFYRWVEDKPEDSVNVINTSKLRLNRPIEKIAEFIDDEGTNVPEILIGDVVVDLKPGHHLRVWWEDGHLYTEIIQGETK